MNLIFVLRWIDLSFLALTLFFSSSVFGLEEIRPGWYLFSREPRVFRPLMADPREVQVRLAYLAPSKTAKFCDLGFGSDLAIVHWHEENLVNHLSLSARGLMTARFNFLSESFDLYNNDFIGGLALGWRAGLNEAEIFLHHQSSHLGDEVLDQHLAKRIDYSRETVRLLLARSYFNSRFYTGVSEHLRAEPTYMNKRFWLHAGAETKFSIKGRFFFLGADFKSKQENDWQLNTALQVGGALLPHKDPRECQRVFLEWFHGYSEMGQFFNQKENSLALVLGYNLP